MAKFILRFPFLFFLFLSIFRSLSLCYVLFLDLQWLYHFWRKYAQMKEERKTEKKMENRVNRLWWCCFSLNNKFTEVSKIFFLLLLPPLFANQSIESTLYTCECEMEIVFIQVWSVWNLCIHSKRYLFHISVVFFLFYSLLLFTFHESKSDFLSLLWLGLSFLFLFAFRSKGSVWTGEKWHF